MERDGKGGHNGWRQWVATIGGNNGWPAAANKPAVNNTECRGGNRDGVGWGGAVISQEGGGREGLEVLGGPLGTIQEPIPSFLKYFRVSFSLFVECTLRF